MNKQTIVIEGNNFNNLESFYDEVDRVLTKNISFKTGHNLDAFNDLLCGGFGVFDYDDTITLIWKDFNKSSQYLDQTVFKNLIEIIQEQKHIKFITVD